MSRVQMLVILVLALVMLAVESYVLLPIHRTLAFKQRISTVSVGILSPPEGDSKRDNAMERACIYYLSSLLSSIVPDKSRAQTLVKKGMTYGDFVSLTKSILQIGTADDIKDTIVTRLRNLIPQSIRQRIRVIAVVRTKWVSEKSSLWMSLGLLSWLVGPCHRFDVPVQRSATASDAVDLPTFASSFAPTQVTENWNSGVRLEKCRYLSEAGCKSACIHLCKRPTEEFFNKELNMPLYMKPNFETSSCELFFGVAPPAVDEDPAYKEACYTACPSIQRNKALNAQTMHRAITSETLASLSHLTGTMDPEDGHHHDHNGNDALDNDDNNGEGRHGKGPRSRLHPLL